MISVKFVTKPFKYMNYNFIFKSLLPITRSDIQLHTNTDMSPIKQNKIIIYNITSKQKRKKGGIFKL